MGNKSLRVIFIALVLAVGAAATASAQFNVSIGFFHDTLAPHGRWVATSAYGNCWVPSGVAAGWAPYVDGEWVWTDYGWTWMSSDPWGDIAYHYGTWVWSPPYGWAWVPGTVWAPAWVTWAYTDDYIGWAPVPVSFAVGINGYAGAPIAAPRASYVFVPARQFTPGVRVASVRVPAAQAPAIYARAHRATAFPVTAGVVHNTGLPVARVEKVTGRRVEVTRADAERLRVSRIPEGKAAKYGVVAPKAERAAAIRQTDRPAHPDAAAEKRPGHEQKAKPNREPVEARPQTAVEKRPVHAEPNARHEAKPKKESAPPRPAPSEPQVRHEAKPKKAQPEHEPAREPQAVPREPQARPAHAEPKAAPHEARPAPNQAQRGNPHGNAQPKPGNPQHGNGQGHDKDNGPGKPKDR